MELLVVNPDRRPLPGGNERWWTELGWQVSTADDYRQAIQLSDAGGIDAVLVADTSGKTDADPEGPSLGAFLEHLDLHRIAGFLLTDAPQRAPVRSNSLIEPVSPDIEPAELRGRLAMIQRYQRMLRQLETQLHNMERLGRQLDRHFRELDEEMRLAGRLQRDFLPRVSGPIGNVEIAASFRPAGWVSGDMYDVIEIDDEHLGLYLADAVGHGVAAGLLTMFIKKAMSPTRVENGRPRILPPAEVLGELNRALIEQSLPQCQFITACYAVLNHRTLTLQYARAGHPYPLIVRADGGMTFLDSAGGLLGVAPDVVFESEAVRLAPGDKALFFTDGIELLFPPDSTEASAGEPYRRFFQSAAGLPLAQMFQRLETALDAEPASFAPRDDITILGLQVSPG